VSKPTSSLLIGLAAACVMTAAACGGGTSGAVTSTSPSAAATASSSSGEIAEDLTFTGALSGHMSSAHRGDTYVCAGSATSLAIGPIVGDVGGKEVSINIVKISFHGAGTYPAGGVGFDVGSDHYFMATGTDSTLVVNADLRSGTVNIDVAVNSDPNSVVGHVSGPWRCPPDAF
jgi:hypothetical protein